MNCGSFYFKFCIFIISILLFIPCLFIPIIYSYYYPSSNSIASNTTYNPLSITISSSGYAWPTPGYTTVTSTFGYRISPTGRTSNFHSGMDIGAPTGATLVSICDAEVVFTGWSGSGGYTIILTSGNLRISYCHTSSYFFVSQGDFVTKGQPIGTIGPKNVYEIPNNPYKDSNGNPTNGDMTGPHLHLTLKKDGKAVNPMILFQ